MKRLTIADIIVSSCIVALVTVTLVPAVARIQRSPAEAKCQSNLRRWAEAMALYCSDNQGTYPTNRFFQASGVVGPIMPSVNLSSPDPLPGQTEPPRFQYGINWVEALYPYIQKSASKSGQDWKSFRRCPNALDAVYPPTYGNCAVTYVFNRSLIERWAQFARDPKKLMMLREFGRLTISMLRPMNDSTGNSGTKPQYAFLDNRDMAVGDTSGECKLHGGGSYIAFADGHIRHFTLDFYPEYRDMSQAKCWDSETQAWYNFGPGSGKGPPYLKSIAITP